MGFPFEVFVPAILIFGLITGGTKLAEITYRYNNNNKFPRTRLDEFQQYMINRDQYIMGNYNVQKAPYGETI